MSSRATTEVRGRGAVLVPHALRLAVVAGAALALGGWALRQPAPGDCGHGAPAAAAREGPTAAFREHHAEILEHLGHIDEMAARLAGETPDRQRATMARIVGFFKDHIAAHAADEERVLYPVVARHAGEGSRLTEVPIYEHRIVERWIAGLERRAAEGSPDAAAFARDAGHLVGLLRAHFEVEEEVLLPVLDAAMTAEEFEREVGSKMPH